MRMPMRMPGGSSRRPAGLVAALAATALVTVVSNGGGNPRVLGYDIEASPERSTVHMHARTDFNWLLALHARKILYCSIAKVASAEWKSSLRWVQGDPKWQEQPHSKRGYDFLDSVPVERANALLNNPEWTRFAVVRQPHERLLSGFMQKCNQYNWKHEYGNCPYLELFPSVFPSRNGTAVHRTPTEETYWQIVAAYNKRGPVSMFHEFAHEMVRRVTAAPCRQNIHYKPQYCHCSLDKTAHLFHIVGFGEHMARDAVAIFKETGVFSGGPIAQEAGWGTPPSEEEVLKFIMEQMGTDNDDAGKKTGSAKKVDMFYTPELKEAVRNAFHVDFELFSRYWST